MNAITPTKTFVEAAGWDEQMAWEVKEFVRDTTGENWYCQVKHTEKEIRVLKKSMIDLLDDYEGMVTIRNRDDGFLIDFGETRADYDEVYGSQEVVKK